MKPVSCDHVTSFNYDDKKARDVGLTCWCHLSNNMPDSIFHESMRQGITCVCVFFCFCFFCAGWYFLFSSGWKRWNQFYHYNISGCGEILSYNGLLIQPWTKVIDYSLPGLTWHTRWRIGISHLSISGIVAHGRCYISHCFYFSVFFYFSVIF